MQIVALIFLLLWQVPSAVPTAENADPASDLPKIKRVYVDRFGGGDGADQVRDMVIASLQRAKLFVVTENPDRADAVLRGSAEDLVFTDVFQSGDSVSARANLGLGKGTSSKSRDYVAAGAGVTDGENTRIQERKHEASASVRLVNKDGDVIWSCTQESLGAKFRSAAADVADKIARQFAQDLEAVKAKQAPRNAKVP